MTENRGKAGRRRVARIGRDLADEQDGGGALGDVDTATASPSALPWDRSTFVAPALPEPSVRMSFPVRRRTRPPRRKGPDQVANADEGGRDGVHAGSPR